MYIVHLTEVTHKYTKNRSITIRQTTTIMESTAMTKIRLHIWLLNPTNSCTKMKFF